MYNPNGKKNPPKKQPEPNDRNTVRAPYNFVPFTDREPFLRYDTVDALPAHNKLCPELCTGEIRLTLTAETPVFVSDGGRENADFVKGADGRYQIPGSTVRGMTRENMQILGSGLVLPGEDLDDRRILYRKLAERKISLTKNLDTKYKNRLNVAKVDYYKYPLPKEVHPGYLKKFGSGDNASYRIYKTTVPAMFVSREKVREVFPFRDPNPRAAEKPGVKAVCYTADGYYVTDIFKPNTKGKENGVLLYTDRYISKKPNHLYVFPAFDEKQSFISVLDEDVIAYKMDCDSYKKADKADIYKLDKMQDGAVLPVFYTRLKDSKGTTHTYFGLTQYPRIGHTHSICDGLPQAQRDKQGVLPLDYPHAILGFTYTEKVQGKDKTTAYRSRVSFGDFAAEQGKKPKNWGKTILGEPKPSFYGGYLAAKNNKAQHYSEDGFRLRGFKQYWLKEAKLPEEQGKEKMENRIKPMPAGTKFTGTVRFRNLHEDELGLLLWSLALNDGCFQTIGMAKPYGFGRVSVKVDSLRLFDWKSLYSAAGFEKTAENKAYEPFIEAYKRYIGEKQADIDTRPEIQDFFYMKRTVRTDTDMVAYLTLQKSGNENIPLFRDMSYPLPTVAALRRKNAETTEREGRE